MSDGRLRQRRNTKIGGGEENSKDANVGAVDSGNKKPEKGAIQISEEVQRAIDAADRLTTGSYFLMADGSVVTRSKSYYNFAGDYAALPGLKRIADSSSQMELFALTDSGDLYFHQTKILGNVTDIVYSTTNVNQKAMCISDGKIYCVKVEPPEFVIDSLREANPDCYFDVGDEVVNYYEAGLNFYDLSGEEGIPATGEFVRLSAEKSDFFVLNSEGQAFMDNNYGNSDEYVGLECFGWKNLAVIDAAKVMQSNLGDSDRQVGGLTVAGVCADGSVVACGEYADEILSWGKLNYIAMDTGLIVGLTPDGTLKVTGYAAEQVADELADWTNIVGINIGSISGGTAVLNAVDADGNYRYLEFDGSCIQAVLTEDGCRDTDEDYWYRYKPDGTVLQSKGENGSWE